ncbi:hypothetical protein FIBSPDRAFT_701354, partial [Athelia psychrophila]
MNEGRTTQLKFDGFTSEPIPVLSGLDQGNPLSMILYVFYAADVLEPELEPEPEPETDIGDELGSAFVDDTALLAAGKTFEETNEKLIKMMERP